MNFYYILLGLLPPALWASCHVIDKVVISKYIKNPLMCILWSAIMYFLFGIGIFFLAPFHLKIDLFTMLAFSSGIIYMLALLMYYQALSREEVSRVTPLLTGLGPLFVLPLATVFFTEIFNLKIYIGIFLILMGAILISFKKEMLKITSIKALDVILITSFLLAVTKCLWKGGLEEINFWSVLFWFYIGTISIGFLLIAKCRNLFFETYCRVKKKVIGAMSLSCVLNLGAMIFFIFVISKWFVSLAAVLAATEGLFTLLFAVCLSIFLPGLLKEELRGSIIFLKFFAIILTMVGIYFIS